MCLECGCGEADHHHDNEHPHTHTHDHEHPHDHGHEAGPAIREIAVEAKILLKNDEIAARNRAWLAERGVTAVNLISAPGSGKTTLLERTLERLRGRVACAVIAGDQRTDHDARRLEGKGAPVVQIETVSACHLSAEQVSRVLPEVVVEGVRLLFIENVGNLVCPAAFDLGESFKVALLSTTEGEDKPVKYPALFSRAQIAVLTKLDLAEPLEWDAPLCRRYLQQAHPGIFSFELSAKTGAGMDAWIDYLEKLTS
jgi:hydrogenase nickel incorporation protein HypB